MSATESSMRLQAQGQGIREPIRWRLLINSTVNTPTSQGRTPLNKKPSETKLSQNTLAINKGPFDGIRGFMFFA